MIYEFEFDPAKSAANLAKHGIDFERAQALFAADPRLEVTVRPGISGEIRWAVIGPLEGKFWTAVFTYRQHAIRLISVRRSRASEEALYEQEELRRGV